MGLHEKDVTKIIGVSEATIYNWENGRTPDSPVSVDPKIFEFIISNQRVISLTSDPKPILIYLVPHDIEQMLRRITKVIILSFTDFSTQNFFLSIDG